MIKEISQPKNDSKVKFLKELTIKKDIKKENDCDDNKLGLVKIYNKDFFTVDGLELAKNLLGKIIKRTIIDSSGLKKELLYKIVETEAYLAPEDKACHAYNNKKTNKTKYFWNNGGSIYIFNIYMPTHYCFNIIASDEKTPHGVLIRAIEPLTEETVITVSKERNKPLSKNCSLNLTNPNKTIKDLFNGPVKAGKSLLIDKEYNGVDICDSDKISLWKYADEKLDKFEMLSTKRINIDYAAEYKDKLWRFLIKDNPYVS